ncbi:MAG TPA: CdaR family protein [Candidatus Sulfotelmatobacter sp.]
MINLFQRYVLHNLGLKILSLLLATGLWFLISPDEQPAEVAVRAPIEFEHVPDLLEISSETIPEAQIRVRGPERLIRQLRPQDVRAHIDLTGSKPGERTFDLTAREVLRPREISVVQVVPGQVHLAFDTRLTRDVEIHPRVTGNFLSGEQIIKVVADPASITITGPRHHVERVDTATTDPVDASGATGSATFTTNVYVSDPLVQVVQPVLVHVTVFVEKVESVPPHK